MSRLQRNCKQGWFFAHGSKCVRKHSAAGGKFALPLPLDGYANGPSCRPEHGVHVFKRRIGWQLIIVNRGDSIPGLEFAGLAGGDNAFRKGGGELPRPAHEGRLLRGLPRMQCYRLVPRSLLPPPYAAIGHSAQPRHTPFCFPIGFRWHLQSIVLHVP